MPIVSRKDNHETATMTRHIDRRHAIEIALPVEEAFPLFTPRGEMDWIADWRPRFIHPADGRTGQGMVFATGSGAEETFWSCVEWSPAEFRVRYARVTPASRFAHVAVACAPSGPARTRVEVLYEMTALTPTGEALLEATTPEVFAASIEGWKSLIATWIAAGRPAFVEGPAPDASAQASA